MCMLAMLGLAGGGMVLGLGGNGFGVLLFLPAAGCGGLAVRIDRHLRVG